MLRVGGQVGEVWRRLLGLGRGLINGGVGRVRDEISHNGCQEKQSGGGRADEEGRVGSGGVRGWSACTLGCEAGS